MLRGGVDIHGAFGGSPLRLDAGTRTVAHTLEQGGSGLVGMHSSYLCI
jgi:hypothetical protein